MTRFLSGIPRVHRSAAVVSAAVLASAATASADDRLVDPTTTLWYTKPATDWQRETLPIGNGAGLNPHLTTLWPITKCILWCGTSRNPASRGISMKFSTARRVQLQD